MFPPPKQKLFQMYWLQESESECEEPIQGNCSDITEFQETVPCNFKKLLLFFTLNLLLNIFIAQVCEEELENTDKHKFFESLLCVCILTRFGEGWLSLLYTINLITGSVGFMPTDVYVLEKRVISLLPPGVLNLLRNGAQEIDIRR